MYEERKVICLYYHVKAKDGLCIKEFEPMEMKCKNFELKLQGEELICKMLDEYTEVEVAKKEVGPYLDSWEDYIFLKYGTNVIEFVYDKAQLCLTRSIEGFNQTTTIVERQGHSEFNAMLTIVSNESICMAPPEYFQSHEDSDAGILFNRYKDYKNGKEKLPAMAYFCLSLLEKSAGNRKQAAGKYKICSKVLDKLGKLSSTKGNLLVDARKAESNMKPLSKKEVEWLEEAIVRIIIQVGEYGHKPSLDLIDMSILPDLE